MKRWKDYFDHKSNYFGASFKANAYTDNKAYQNIQNVTHQIVDKFGRNGNVIIDIGCGNGVLMQPLVGRFQIIGVDHSLSALRYAHKRGLIGLQSEADQLPLKDGIGDIIVNNGMLQYLQRNNLPNFLNETHRITKVGGLIVISTLNPSSFLRRIYGLAYNDIGTCFESMFSLQEIVGHLQRLDINILEYYYFFTPINYWRKAFTSNPLYTVLSSTYLVVGKRLK